MALFADPVFADTGRVFERGAVWTAMLAYALQVYCDFSGYSDMAIGLGHLLGYKLPRNFDMPYLAGERLRVLAALAHLALALVPRLRVHAARRQPRRGAGAPTRISLITMALVGLWHGAAWHFVVFGTSSRRRAPSSPRRRRARRARANWREGPVTCLGHALRVARTFLVFNTGTVLFRSATIATAGEVYGRMLMPRDGLGLPLPADGFWCAVAAIDRGVTPSRRRAVASRRRTRTRAADRRRAGGARRRDARAHARDEQAFIYFQF